MAIKGMHAMFYSAKADELRAFIRDKLAFSATDVGDGWLIFDVPDAEIGCHPAEKPSHELSFYCDDVEATMAELKSRGVEFTMGVEDQGYGLVTAFKLPDGSEVQLYQPSYTRA